MNILRAIIRSLLSRVGANREEGNKTDPPPAPIVEAWPPVVTCHVRGPDGAWTPLEVERPPPGDLSRRRKHIP